MKTIITSTGNSPDADFDQRFGRCAYFCLYDEDSRETEFVKNDAANANEGAGRSAAAAIAKLGAGKVISGDFGHKAKDILEQMNIQMVVVDGKSKSVYDIIQQIK